MSNLQSLANHINETTHLDHVFGLKGGLRPPKKQRDETLEIRIRFQQVDLLGEIPKSFEVVRPRE
jgi:hypothetical protein